MYRVTVTAAAQRLGVSQDAIYKRIKRGTIPWDKAEDGKTVFYLEEANGPINGPDLSIDESAERLKTSTDTPGSSPQEYADLADGEHTLRVRAKDHAGNVDQSPAEVAFAVDITAPTITSTKPAEGKKGVKRASNISTTFSASKRGAQELLLEEQFHTEG